MKRNRFEYRGMAVVMAVYLLMAVILLTERAGIGYQLSSRRVSLLPAESTMSVAEAYQKQVLECLCVYDSQSSSSMEAVKQFKQIFQDMKVGCQWADVRAGAIPSLKPFRTAAILLSNYSPLGEWVLQLGDWVYEGGRALLPLTPEKELTFMLLERKMGILNSSYENELVEAIRFADGFLLGGEDVYSIPNAYQSAKKLELAETARVYAWDADENACPLIWSNNYGKGRFVAGNFGLMEKTVRGLYAACYTLLEDAFAYPVINGSAFYLDDFPSPIPAGDAENIREDYHMSVQEFYTNVWWPDMLAIAEKHDIRYTGVMIQTYADQTDGAIAEELDPTQFSYLGESLLHANGEIGLHGYNHQPLNLGSIEYGEDLPYELWESEQAMRNGVEELMRLIRELFPEAQEYVYVPPSNVLSPEGRAMLGSYYPTIHTIASTYFEGSQAYEQEFTAAQDGIVEQPRILSGCIVDDFVRMAALSELNFHLVNTYFIHPDDVLDEARGAALGWETMKNNLSGFLDWLNEACPALRRLSGSELSGAVQRFSSVSVERETADRAMKLSLGGFADEAYLLLRMEEGKNPAASGGKLSRLTESLYLLRADQSEVTITWSE